MENHDETKGHVPKKDENRRKQRRKNMERRGNTRKENDNERWKRKKERTGHIHEDKDQELKTQTTN